MTGTTIDTPENRKAYRRGWDAFNRGSMSALENADDRGEPAAWYIGFNDANEAPFVKKYEGLQ